MVKADMRTLNFNKRIDELTWSAVMSSYNQALINKYKERAGELSPDDEAFLYTLIEEEVSIEEALEALVTLRKLKEKVLWITSRDGIVCEDCEVMDGTEFSVREVEGILPAHHNCRCVWAPVGV